MREPWFSFAMASPTRFLAADTYTWDLKLEVAQQPPPPGPCGHARADFRSSCDAAARERRLARRLRD